MLRALSCTGIYMHQIIAETAMPSHTRPLIRKIRNPAAAMRLTQTDTVVFSTNETDSQLLPSVGIHTGCCQEPPASPREKTATACGGPRVREKRRPHCPSQPSRTLTHENHPQSPLVVPAFCYFSQGSGAGADGIPTRPSGSASTPARPAPVVRRWLRARGPGPCPAALRRRCLRTTRTGPR